VGKVNSLEIYGDQLKAYLNLTGELDLGRLSSLPSLAWFETKQLQVEYTWYLNEYYSKNPDLRGHYQKALLEIAKTANPAKNYNIETYINYFEDEDTSKQEQIIIIHLTKSSPEIFNSEGIFLGKIKISDKSGNDISNELIASALAGTYSPDPEEFNTEQLIILLKGVINESGTVIGIDFNNDNTTDINLGPLDYNKIDNQLTFDSLFTSDATAINVSELVVHDIVVEGRDPGGENESWKDWNPILVSKVNTLWGELNVFLDNSLEETLNLIPANWQVRLSYDDLLNEDISKDALDKHNGLYLVFNVEVIEQIFKALAEINLEEAKLEIGPKLSIQNFNLKDYKNSSELYTAISSANWIEGEEGDKTHLRLKAINSGKGLEEFKVKLMIKRYEENYQQVYNVLSLAYKKTSEWILADPDGYSLMETQTDNTEPTIIKIDRYGDELDTIGLWDEGNIAPEWQAFNPSFIISANLTKPWDQQATSAKTIEINGSRFDSGEDIIINLYHEIADNPQTLTWEGSWKTYTIILDLYSDDIENSKLSTENQNIIFNSEPTSDSSASYKQNYYIATKINTNEELNVRTVLYLFKDGLDKFINDLNDENLNYVNITSPSIEVQNSYNTQKSEINFTAAPGITKPSVSIYARFNNDENNQLDYERASQLYYEYLNSSDKENVYNYGSNTGEFLWASTNPLGNEDNAKQLIIVYYNGITGIANISETGSFYAPGDINLTINNKQIEPNNYEINLSNWQMQIILTTESKLEIDENSTIIFQLNESHKLIDTNGKRLKTKNNIEVENYAAWISMGFNPSKQLILNPTESYADRRKINLAFYGEPKLSLDSSKVEVPESEDFQFWSFNYHTGKWSDEPLKLDKDKPIEISKDGKTFEFNLAEPIKSDVKIEVSYDPTISKQSGVKPFTDINELTAETFYWQPIENKSPDQEGPVLSWAIVVGKYLSIQLDDPAGIKINNLKLSNVNLPKQTEFEIKTNTRHIFATNINLNSLDYLELTLESDIKAGETVNVSYLGSTLKDGLGNVANIHNTVVENYTVEFNQDDASTWFQNNDVTNIVFNKDTDPLTGWFLMENGTLSAENKNYQIQDDYIFKLDNLSKLNINLTDLANLSLDDDGDANLDFIIENINTKEVLGGSWNSKNDIYQEKFSNDERNINYILPSGDYKLSVYHAETWRNNNQNYQLEINYSPFALQASQLSKQEFEKNIPIGKDTTDKDIYIEILDEGLLELSTSNKDLYTSISLYSLDGQWINSNYTNNFNQYVIPGIYHIEFINWSKNEKEINLKASLDNSVVLNINSDTEENPSGSVVVNGRASKGELNTLDIEDFWKLKLSGKKIYSIRASDFTEDVNISVETIKKTLFAESWNWGSYNETGKFTPSDETIIIDLSSSEYKENEIYEFSLRSICYSSNPTQYSLIAKEHLNLKEAEVEASRNISNYKDVYNKLFKNENSDNKDIIITPDDLENISTLRNVSSDKLLEKKAELEQQKISINGNILGLENLLVKQKSNSNDAEINAILINKQYPNSLPSEISNKLNLNQPGELASASKERTFGAQEISDLISKISNKATSVKPISKTIDVRVESKQGRISGFLWENLSSNKLVSDQSITNKVIKDDLGLQRICINLDEETQNYIIKNADQTLVWFKSPVDGDYSIFEYDKNTTTGSVLESSGNNNKIDTMALYIQDGGRGDDDKLVNGKITAPGGLAFVKLIKTDTVNDEITNWKADLDNDGIISPLTDGLALAKRFSTPMVGMDPTLQNLLKKFDSNSLNSIDSILQSKKLDLDKSGKVDLNDINIIIRHSFGTYPKSELTEGLNLIGNASLSQINEQLGLMQPIL